MKIGVIGCGNVGFAFLVWLSKKGHNVIGYDCNPSVQKKIEQFLAKDSVAKRLDGLEACEVIFICVPTEPQSDGAADMSIYEAVINELSTITQGGKTVVVQRSTCPPGSAEKYSKVFSENVSYGVNPSFLRKSSIEYDTEYPDRVAFAGDKRVQECLYSIYDGLDTPFFVTEDTKTVELLKYIENTIDAMLISYWNEMLLYSSHLSISAEDFVKLVEHIGDRDKFKTVSRIPGKAFGMWCLPKDLRAIIHEMMKCGISPNVLIGTLSTNDQFCIHAGVGEIPGQELWVHDHNTVRILDSGKKQILDSLNHNSV